MGPAAVREPLLERGALRELRAVVLDEADAMIQPLSRYATVKQKSTRESHPKEVGSRARER